MVGVVAEVGVEVVGHPFYYNLLPHIVVAVVFAGHCLQYWFDVNNEWVVDAIIVLL